MKVQIPRGLYKETLKVLIELGYGSLIVTCVGSNANRLYVKCEA